MANIKPVQNFVLVKFIPKVGGEFFMPDGTRNPSSYVVVQAVGPDVPKEPKLEAGMKVLLRGDAKVFGIENIPDQACIPYPVIMAIDGRKDGEEEEYLNSAKVDHLLQTLNSN